MIFKPLNKWTNFEVELIITHRDYSGHCVMYIEKKKTIGVTGWFPLYMFHVSSIFPIWFEDFKPWNRSLLGAEVCFHQKCSSHDCCRRIYQIHLGPESSFKWSFSLHVMIKIQSDYHAYLYIYFGHRWYAHLNFFLQPIIQKFSKK